MNEEEKEFYDFEQKLAINGDDSPLMFEEMKKLVEQQEKKISNERYDNVLKKFTVETSKERVLFWNLLIMMFTLYNCIIIPIKICFPQEYFTDRQISTIMAFDFIGDILFLIDIALRFVTPYYESGFIVKDRKEIALHYLKSWFVVDLIASLCFPISAPYISKWKLGKNLQTNAWLRMGIFLRLGHFGEIFTNWRQYMTEFTSWVRLIQLVIVLCLTIHWISCIYIFLAFYENWPSNSYSIPIVYKSETLFEIYSYAVDYGIRFVLRVGGSVVVPVTPLEKAVVNIESPFVLFLAAMIIGSIVSLMNQFDADKMVFESKMIRLNNFIKKRKLDSQLTVKLKSFIQREFSKGFAHDEKTVIEMFPPYLKREIIQQIHKELIQKVDFFNGSLNLVDAILPFLVRDTNEEGAFVFRTGDISNEIFFISKGFVVIKEDNEIIDLLETGDFFGEEILTGVKKRKYDVECMTPTELFSITKKKL